MQMINFWVVRKGEDARKVAPEVADAISKHRDQNRCLFCDSDQNPNKVPVLREIGAVIAIREHEPIVQIFTVEICMDCARHSDEELAEMTRREVYPDLAKHQRKWAVKRRAEILAVQQGLIDEGWLVQSGEMRRDPETGHCDRSTCTSNSPSRNPKTEERKP